MVYIQHHIATIQNDQKPKLWLDGYCKTYGSDSSASKWNDECLKSCLSVFPLHGYSFNLYWRMRNYDGWNPAAEMLNQIAFIGQNTHN